MRKVRHRQVVLVHIVSACPNQDAEAGSLGSCPFCQSVSFLLIYIVILLAQGLPLQVAVPFMRSME